MCEEIDRHLFRCMSWHVCYLLVSPKQFLGALRTLKESALQELTATLVSCRFPLEIAGTHCNPNSLCYTHKRLGLKGKISAFIEPQKIFSELYWCLLSKPWQRWGAINRKLSLSLPTSLGALVRWSQLFYFRCWYSPKPQWPINQRYSHQLSIYKQFKSASWNVVQALRSKCVRLKQSRCTTERVTLRQLRVDGMKAVKRNAVSAVWNVMLARIVKKKRNLRKNVRCGIVGCKNFL